MPPLGGVLGENDPGTDFEPDEPFDRPDDPPDFFDADEPRTVGHATPPAAPAPPPAPSGLPGGGVADVAPRGGELRPDEPPSEPPSASPSSALTLSSSADPAVDCRRTPFLKSAEARRPNFWSAPGSSPSSVFESRRIARSIDTRRDDLCCSKMWSDSAEVTAMNVSWTEVTLASAFLAAAVLTSWCIATFNNASAS